MMKPAAAPARLPFAFFASFPSRPLRIAFAFLALAAAAHAQDAKSLVSTAVNNELAADKSDHAAFMYRDHDVTPDHDTLYYVVETPQGNLKKLLEDHGHPLTAEQRSADNARIAALLADPAAQAKARNASSHDDNQAVQMLRLLPSAYIWTIAGEEGNLVTLNFKPDPNFSPNSFEAKVLSAMGGQIQVQKPEMRIASIKGTLLDDVTFGWGILGRLRKGGSFDVVRKEVAPGHWQETLSNVHINGRALFFKTIGSDEDETRTDFKPSPAQTLKQADEILKEIR
jgi:hypothetical protein